MKAVATSLELTVLGTQDKPAKNAATKSVEAHNAYLQGHFYFERGNLEDYRKAVGFFDQATGLDTDYALAYAECSQILGLDRRFKQRETEGGLDSSRK
jgi:hypothetical protein